MKKSQKLGSRLAMAALTGVLLVTACGAPGTATQFPPDMQTAAAMTVNAMLSATPEATEAPLASPTAMIVTATGEGTTGTPTTPTATTGTPSTSATPTGAARMTVEDVTNCRKGPGAGYELVTQITAGKEISILGSLTDYWLVQTDAGVCWVAREFATPMGNIGAVPTVTAPPTQQGGAVAAPSIMKWTYACGGDGRADLAIDWIDKATNEAGYRIYMNGEVIKELPAGSTQFASSVLVPAGLTVEFYVEAFNTTGKAQSVVYTFSC